MVVEKHSGADPAFCKPRWAAEPPSSSGCPSTGNPNSAQPRPGSRQASSSCDAAALRSSIPGLGGGRTHVSHHGVPLLGTSSAGQPGYARHCLFQAVAHCRTDVRRGEEQGPSHNIMCSLHFRQFFRGVRATVRPFRRPFPPCTTRAFPLPFGPSSFGSKKPANHQPSPDVQVSADHRRSRRVEPFGAAPHRRGRTARATSAPPATAPLSDPIAIAAPPAPAPQPTLNDYKT